MKRTFVVAMTGASGAVYARRLIDVLTASGCDVHLSLSAACVPVLKQELDLAVDPADFQPALLVPGLADGRAGRVHYHHHADLAAPIASGSFPTQGMIVCPCSMGTLSAIVHGTSANLIHRAADVHLKERRPLILVARETPLSLVHLENMTHAARAGATILPAMPAFYHGVRGVEDLIDFVVARICDHLQVPHDLVRRWGE